MKTVIYKLSIVALVLLVNTANAQKTVSKWNWDSMAAHNANGDTYNIDSRVSLFNISNPGAEPASVLAGPKKANLEVSQACLNYCPVGNGSVVCELAAEDHCPMNGYWHSNTNKPRHVAPNDSALTDLSFSVMK